MYKTKGQITISPKFRIRYRISKIFVGRCLAIKIRGKDAKFNLNF